MYINSPHTPGLYIMLNKGEREVAQSCLTLCDPMDPPSMEFSRQEYWSGLPFPSPGDLPKYLDINLWA